MSIYKIYMVEPKMKFIIPYSNKVMLILYSRIISYLIFIILLYSNIILMKFQQQEFIHSFLGVLANVQIFVDQILKPYF